MKVSASSGKKQNHKYSTKTSIFNLCIILNYLLFVFLFKIIFYPPWLPKSLSPFLINIVNTKIFTIKVFHQMHNKIVNAKSSFYPIFPIYGAGIERCASYLWSVGWLTVFPGTGSHRSSKTRSDFFFLFFISYPECRTGFHKLHKINELLYNTDIY